MKLVDFLFIDFNVKVLLKTQSTALGVPLDTERLAAVSASLKALRDIRTAENTRYSLENRDLWIRDSLGDNLRHSASRELIGFVTSAQFSYQAGASTGVGFVALLGLRQLTAQRPSESGAEPAQPVVLVRETTSLQYRFARLEVVVV
jgi:hypothetical protein